MSGPPSISMQASSGISGNSLSLYKMKLLQNYASPLVGLLKDQRLREGEPYRLMHFVVRQPVEEGLLLYNVLTRAVVLLTPEEARAMEEDAAAVPALVAKWFAVPLSFDDRNLAREVRAVGKMLEKRPKGITGYTILTTTDCNARCFYCYEKGRRRIPMTDRTARKAAEFILRNSPGEKVHLRWFGGEPLYNKGVISLICGLLRDAKVDYRSSMVSNGYLFDDQTIAEAVGLWNLEKVQITLDGTEEIYNEQIVHLCGRESLPACPRKYLSSAAGGHPGERPAQHRQAQCRRPLQTRRHPHCKAWREQALHRV